MVDLRLIQVGHGNGNHWWKVNYPGYSSCESFAFYLFYISYMVNSRFFFYISWSTVYYVKKDVRLLIAAYPRSRPHRMGKFSDIIIQSRHAIRNALQNDFIEAIAQNTF